MTARLSAAAQAEPPLESSPTTTSTVRSGPASLAQRRLWFLYRLHPEALVYQASAAVEIDGRLDVDALRQALRGAVERHEILRTRIVPDAQGEPLQLVTAPSPDPMAVYDLSRLPERARDEQARQWLTEMTERPFLLEREVPFRIALVRLAPTRHLFVVAFHHIAFDGLSWGVLVTELRHRYEAAVAGRPVELPPPPLQHVDFARRQQEATAGDGWREQLSYWQQQLADIPPVINLPLDRVRPSESSHGRDTVEVRLPGPLAKAIRGVDVGLRITPFMTLLTAFQTLLHRYSGDRTVVVGTPVAGRNGVDLEQLIGFFVDTVALRADFADDVSFRDLLRATRRTVLQAMSRLDVPFDEVVRGLGAGRQLSYHPVFQTMFQLNSAAGPALELPGVTCTELVTTHAVGGVDLHLSLAEHPGGEIEGWLSYATDLFDRSTAARFARDYVTLLNGLVGAPEQPVHGVPLLTASERSQILHSWGNGGRALPSHRTLPDRVDGIAAATPHAVAVEFDGVQVTFDELAGRSDRLAQLLRARGVGPETVVGALLKPGIEAVTATLAVHRAGGAVLGIDPRDPGGWSLSSPAHTGAALVVTTSDLAHLVDHSPLLLLDEQDATPAARPTALIGRRANDRGAAHLLHTGTVAGRPTGVVIEHRSLTGRLAEAGWSSRLAAGDRCLQAMPHGSYGWLAELVTALSVGATLVIDAGLLHLPPQRLVERCRDLRLTALHLPASCWGDLVDAGAAAEFTEHSGVRWVSVESGTAVTPERIRRWQREVCDRIGLRVLSGSPECGLFCASAEVTDMAPDRPALASRVMSNTRLYVLGRTGQPVGVGEVGELHVAGDGLARGYFGQPGLTAASFVADPVSAVPGERLFRTGRLARWRSGGDLVMESPALPGLPRTPAGTEDRSALPAPAEPGTATRESVAPRDEIEARLTELWRKLLKVNDVGVMDDFFVLGGHSLLAARLVNRIERSMGVALPVSALFPSATIAQLAVQIRDRRQRADPVVVRLRDGSSDTQLVLVHPVGGEVVHYSALVAAVPASVAVHGIRSPLLDDDTAAATNLESLAANYLSRLRARGIDRPAVYGGWSMGGVIALEMARQAQERDARQPLVLAIDSAFVGPDSPAFAMDDESLLAAFVENVYRTTGLRPHDSVAEDPLEALHATLREAGRLGAEVGPEWVAARFQVFSTHLRLLAEYRPRPYPGPVVLILTKRNEDRERRIAAWRSVAAGGLEVLEVPADHYSIIGPEHAAAISVAMPFEER